MHNPYAWEEIVSKRIRLQKNRYLEIRFVFKHNGCYHIAFWLKEECGRCGGAFGHTTYLLYGSFIVLSFADHVSFPVLISRFLFLVFYTGFNNSASEIGLWKTRTIHEK